MRFQDPLIIGAGPAGSAAAIVLAQGGARPVIWERQAVIGDALCGGFLSWETLSKLKRLGVEPRGHPIDHLRVYAGVTEAQARLPAGAVGLSRHCLDTAMLDRARASGAGYEIVNVRDADDVKAESVFLATGKHDLRGLGRPKWQSNDATLGLRIKLAAHPKLARLLGNAIELHLFDRGYAGLLLQEDGRANLCLAVRKSRFAEAGSDPKRLLLQLAEANPVLGERLAQHQDLPKADAIAAVPYGWRAIDTLPGVFRLGDQAAVIPSLAGEGIGIAIASGTAAANAWLKAGADGASAYQRDFSRRVRRPIAVARFLWERGESPATAALSAHVLALAPLAARILARLTRIGD